MKYKWSLSYCCILISAVISCSLLRQKEDHAHAQCSHSSTWTFLCLPLPTLATRRILCPLFNMKRKPKPCPHCGKTLIDVSRHLRTGSCTAQKLWVGYNFMRRPTPKIWNITFSTITSSPVLKMIYFYLGSSQQNIDTLGLEQGHTNHQGNTESSDHGPITHEVQSNNESTASDGTIHDQSRSCNKKKTVPLEEQSASSEEDALQSQNKSITETDVSLSSEDDINFMARKKSAGKRKNNLLDSSVSSHDTSSTSIGPSHAGSEYEIGELPTSLIEVGWHYIIS